MFFRMMLLVWEFGLELAAVSRMTDSEKDLELLLLRQHCGSSSGNRNEDRQFHAGRRGRWRC